MIQVFYAVRSVDNQGRSWIKPASSSSKSKYDWKENDKMNPKWILKSWIAILLAALVLAGCASTKTDPCPTSAPCPTAQACPTAQVCPTAAAQAATKMSAWRQTISSLSNIVITIDPGDKCSVTVSKPLTSDIIFYEIVVNDQAYPNYLIGIETLDPGKTLDDLEALPKKTTAEPAWVSIDLESDVGPMTRTWAKGSFDPAKGPLYVTCLVEESNSLKIIGNFGPIEVPAK
jgi:hypothetical protein